MRIKHITLILLLCTFASVGAQQKLVILHTNDTHSRIEPLPPTDKKYPDMGGVINRKTVIDSIRQAEDNVLLIDAGDFVQGTPYFNVFYGRTETEALNAMGYEVGTIGNHEFDNGLQFMRKFVEDLKYPIVNCNYDFTGTPVEGLVQPYTILKKGNITIGIIGVGVDPEGLIQKNKYEGMKFNPIIENVNHYAAKIRKECDVVICLSHIGIVQDRELAKESENIDLIIGGHSHTFMEKPERIKNLKGKEVLVHQVGKNGTHIGKIELMLNKKK